MSANRGRYFHDAGVLCLVACLISTLSIQPQPASAEPSGPIRLHPGNPHYLSFRGRTTVLITSGEHFGSVLNPDFNYVAYLDALQAKGFNFTRVVNGTFYDVLKPDSMDQRNTLAPRPGRYLAPWSRSGKPGFYGGGNKFDLDRWDENYFRRLREFVNEAGKRGIVVEIILFGSTHDSAHWVPSPFQGSNNVNGIGATYTNFFTSMFDPPLLQKAEMLVRKTATELNAYDNVFYEICNGCYLAGEGRTDDWQNRLVATLVTTEAALPAKHLIALNYQEAPTHDTNPSPQVSILTYSHTASSSLVGRNYRSNRAVALQHDVESVSTDDRRRQAWSFVLSGGAIYSNVDSSYTVADPTGSQSSVQEGRDAIVLRNQIKVLKDFVERLDLIRMQPNTACVRGIPEGAAVQALLDPGNAYAIYLNQGNQATLTLEPGKGRYRAEWINPQSGHLEKGEDLNHQGGPMTLVSPRYESDIVLKVLKINP